MGNKRPKSNFPNMLITLLAITVAGSFAIAWVYQLTAAPISIVKKEKTSKAIKEVLPANIANNPVEAAKTIELGGEGYECYFGKDEQGNITSYAIKSTSHQAYSGELVVMVGFLADGTIQNVKVLEQKETPGLGTKITEAAFLQQFLQKNPQSFSLKVKKDGGDVDAVTAATISSRAFCDGVNRAYQAFLTGKK